MERTATLGFLIGVANAFGAYRCPTAISRGAVFGASCYEFIAEERTWKNARELCHARGGRLATVGNEAAQSWLSASAEQEFPNRQGVWLGLNDRTHEGTFVWDNYRTLAAMSGSYFNWNAGEPNDQWTPGNQDCVYMRRSYQWRWVDVECDTFLRKYSSVCEYEAIGLHWSSNVPFTVLPTLPARTWYASTVGLATDGAKADTRSSKTQGHVRTTLPAETTRVSTAKSSTDGPEDDERSLTTQKYITAAAELFLDLKTERLATPWPDTVQLELLSAIGAIVLILIVAVIVLAIWAHGRSRTRMNAATIVALTASSPTDTAAQPKDLCCPPEWRSPIKAEVVALLDSSLKQKQVDEPTPSRRSSSGNIYVDIDTFSSHEQVAVSSTILGSADTNRAGQCYIGADAEVTALPPAPPPPPPTSRLPVTEAGDTPTRDLLATAAANGVKSADVAVAIVGALALQTPSDLAVVSGAAAGRAAEGYLEFVSRRTPSETLPIPSVCMAEGKRPVERKL